MRILFVSLVALLLLNFPAHASHQWVKKADFGSFGRHRGAGMAIGNKVYAGTGHLNGTGFDTWYPDWWEYDAGTNAWTQKADYPGNNGNGDQDIVALSFGNVGYAGLGQLDNSSFYKFDPVINVWTQVSSPPAASFNNTFPFRIGDYGYFPALFSNSFYRYDPANDLWTLMNPLPFTTNYGIPTMAMNGKGYIKNAVNFYEYDVTTDSWTSKAPFPGLYPNRPAMVDQNGYGFVIGGSYGSTWIWGDEVWRYDPTNDSWFQMEDFAGTTRRWAVLVNLHDHVYYGLGTNGTNFNDWWEFSSTADLDDVTAMEVKVYPNPATEFVEFTSKSTEFEVELYTLTGKKVAVATTQTGQLRFETAHFESGMYLYSVQSEGERETSGEFIVQ